MQEIYVDHHATTPLSPLVLEAMMPFMQQQFGNPHALYYQQSRDAQIAIEQARADISKHINAKTSEIIFTSGATESNNMVILGVTKAIEEQGKIPHIITSAIEHSAVLAPARYLNQQYPVDFIPCDGYGRCDLDILEQKLKYAQQQNHIPLVSIMSANNEIGTFQPLENIALLVKQYHGLLHSDATQSIGRQIIDVKKIPLDYLSFNAHKIYGPKGIGALFIRKKPKAPIVPLFYGGNQESGLRAGTLPVPLVVGFAEAMRLIYDDMADEQQRLSNMRDELALLLQQQCPNMRINGVWQTRANERLAHNLHISLDGVSPNEFRQYLHNVALSYGSACQAGDSKPSYILQATGIDAKIQATHLRIGLGKDNHHDDMRIIAKRVGEAYENALSK